MYLLMNQSMYQLMNQFLYQLMYLLMNQSMYQLMNQFMYPLECYSDSVSWSVSTHYSAYFQLKFHVPWSYRFIRETITVSPYPITRQKQL
jgi:hypothetical protein